MNGTVRIIGASLCWVLVVASSAGAEGAWVLWARSCDVRTQVCGGEWQRRETYEAERWCRAARTTAANQALTRAAGEAAKGTVVEYECLPDTADPRRPKGTK
jgi:hypothetical protein